MRNRQAQCEPLDIYATVARLYALFVDNTPYEVTVSRLPGASLQQLMQIHRALDDCLHAVMEWTSDRSGDEDLTPAEVASAISDTVTQLYDSTLPTAFWTRDVTEAVHALPHVFRPIADNLDDFASLVAHYVVLEAETSRLAGDVRALRAGDDAAQRSLLKTARRVFGSDSGLTDLDIAADQIEFKLVRFRRFCELAGLRVERLPSVTPPVPRSCQTPAMFGALTDASQLLAAEVVLHPRTIFRLTGREFEAFLRSIFQSFGFTVELTAASHDGGADLLCMTSRFGIPLTIAVQAKRYAPDRPISVELVRAFVGANEQWHANKLIYVTTSRFTKSSIDYATSIRTNLLTLADLHKVVEWSRLSLVSTPEAGHSHGSKQS